MSSLKQLILCFLLVGVLCFSGCNNGKKDLESQVQNLENRVNELDARKKQDEAEQKALKEAEQKAIEEEKRKKAEAEKKNDLVGLSSLRAKLKKIEERIEKNGDSEAYYGLEDDIASLKKEFDNAKDKLDELYSKAKNESYKKKIKEQQKECEKLKARLNTAKKELDGKFGMS